MTIASTEQGKVRGQEKLGCMQFRGIPFAAPPVGPLRWRPPQQHEGWSGELDCTEFGPICPQVAGAMEQLAGSRNVDPQDEDCLTLNVYTPAADDGRRPVMVWIHGGGFTTGSGRVPWYGGHTFARDGVVCVTINYRLSVLGFLHLEEMLGPDYRDSGTLGIQDQVAALRWVQANIANFGGDPDNVTIFGESAGGMSVGCLLAAPSARGSFHKAIPQSGAAHSANAPDVAARIARSIVQKVSGTTDAEALLAMDAGQLVGHIDELGTSLASENADLFGRDFAGIAMPFQPVHGGDVLPTVPIDAIRAGSAAGIPTLVGTTAQEWKLFTITMQEDGVRSRAVRPLRNLFEQAGRSVDELVAAYERSLPNPSELDIRNALETDRIFRIPAIRLAEAQGAQGAPAFMYRFDWKTPAFGGRMGACHALEIPFVFDNLDAPGVDVFTGGAAPQDLATDMHAAWVSFAKTGDPGWPAYEPSSRQTMLFDAERTIIDDPEGELRELWTGLL